MLKRFHELSSRVSLLRPLVHDPLDFGDVVAVLIVTMGLISFASAGLWTP
jgi:hypothetical protein